jgi:hypothetical protein
MTDEPDGDDRWGWWKVLVPMALLLLAIGYGIAVKIKGNPRRASIHIGMSADEVKAVLGPPIRETREVDSVAEAKIWKQWKPGDPEPRLMERWYPGDGKGNRIVLHFANGKVARIDTYDEPPFGLRPGI